MADDDQSSESSRIDEWDAAVWKSIMEDSKGRYMIERLLERCGALAPRYNHDGDALGMAWRDGRAAVGAFIESELERSCPDLLLRMIKERRNRLTRQLDQQRKETAAQQERPFRGATDVERMADAQRAEDEAKRPNGQTPQAGTG
jgi:hypothetical protein